MCLTFLQPEWEKRARSYIFLEGPLQAAPQFPSPCPHPTHTTPGHDPGEGGYPQGETTGLGSRRRAKMIPAGDYGTMGVVKKFQVLQKHLLFAKSASRGRNKQPTKDIEILEICECRMSKPRSKDRLSSNETQFLGFRKDPFLSTADHSLKHAFHSLLGMFQQQNPTGNFDLVGLR